MNDFSFILLKVAKSDFLHYALIIWVPLIDAWYAKVFSFKGVGYLLSVWFARPLFFSIFPGLE